VLELLRSNIDEMMLKHVTEVRKLGFVVPTYKSNCTKQTLFLIPKHTGINEWLYGSRYDYKCTRKLL
jgi:hypothetical protein